MTTVLLHPIGLDGATWQFLSESFLSDAVTPDLLGHGRKPMPAGLLDLDVIARDIVDNVDGPLDLVGVSFGGAVALTIALGWPSRVSSLLLAASGVGGHRDALRARGDEVEEVGMAGILDVTLRRWFTTAVLEEPGHPAVEYARSRLIADDVASFAASWRALADLDAGSRLPEITCPVTVLHPLADATGSLEGRTQIAETLPHGRVASLPGPHMVQLEEPAAFEAAVVDHLDWAGVA